MNKLLKILLILNLLSCSRNTNNEIILSKDSDTVFWKKRVTERNNKLISLQDVEKSKGEIFRFSIQNLIVETNCSDSQCFGKVIFFVQKMKDEYGLEMENEIFKKEFKLTESQINQIKILIANSKIKNLPSDKLIKGWNTRGNDGETYIFETKMITNILTNIIGHPTFKKKYMKRNKLKVS